jgi:hypothetical protein
MVGDGMKERLKVKIVYNDDKRDKAVVGIKITEDDQFFSILTDENYTIQVAKNRIVMLRYLKE